MNIFSAIADIFRRNGAIIKHYRDTLSMSDKEAMEDDWGMVGEDIQKVLDALENANPEDFREL